MKTFLLLILGFVVIGCSGLEHTEKQKIRSSNQSKEPILRHEGECYFAYQAPQKKLRAKYPWEEKFIGQFSRITKDSFRCRGSNINPEKKYGEETLTDCGGLLSHSLPVLDGEEFIYPRLIDLLNHLQKVTEKRVVISAGYRCPEHNRYVNPERRNLTSKHQIGAEVDFYIQGLEDAPEEIVKSLMKFYEEDEPQYKHFRKSIKERNGIKYPIWFNKEIFITINHFQVTQDLDSQFPHPYITIELRHDRDREQRVEYTWQKAHNGYMRY